MERWKMRKRGRACLAAFCGMLFLAVFLAGCGVQRAPGGVMRPSAETSGYTVFRFDWNPRGLSPRQNLPLVQSRDRQDPNQFALWLETEQGQYIRTLAVTEDTALRGWDGRPSTLPHWQAKAGFQAREQWKDVNATIVSVFAEPEQTFVWYGDTFNGSQALPDGTYRYCLEAAWGSDLAVYYVGTVKLGSIRNHSFALPAGPVPSRPLVAGLTAEFIPSQGHFFGMQAWKDSWKNLGKKGSLTNGSYF
ncbi:MAG: DUF4136 domain-containing protein [Succiniclasticum sp.]|jgi:hypothetical protein